MLPSQTIIALPTGTTSETLTSLENGDSLTYQSLLVPWCHRMERWQCMHSSLHYFNRCSEWDPLLASCRYAINDMSWVYRPKQLILSNYSCNKKMHITKNLMNNDISWILPDQFMISSTVCINVNCTLKVQWDDRFN